VNVGMIGYGFMGGAHLAALQAIEGVRVKSVATRSRPSVTGAVKGNLDLKSGPLPPDIEWHSDWRQVTADPEIDAVDVCLPTDLHKQVVLAALAAGKHVLCEKPMAFNTDDCDVMLAAAKQSGRVFMVGQVLRFMFPYRYAADFVATNGSKSVRRCTFQRSTGFPGWGGWLGDEARSGGAILDLLCHDLDMALSIFGPPDRVSSMSQGPVDTVRAALHYPGELMVQVEGGWFAPETPFSASFRVETETESLSFEAGVLQRLKSDGAAEVIRIPEHDPYADEIAYFMDCCRANAAPKLCLPQESAAAVRLANLVKASRDANGKEMEWQK
jgi:predicted dehydrogenase